MKRSYEMDMCHGPVFGKLVRFAIPLILSGMLQFCFNAADVIVVGRFTGKEALAICTISDCPLTGESSSSEERQTSFTQMMEIALQTAIRL